MEEGGSQEIPGKRGSREEAGFPPLPPQSCGQAPGPTRSASPPRPATWSPRLRSVGADPSGGGVGAGQGALPRPIDDYWWYRSHIHEYL